NLKELREKIAEFIPEKDLNCVNILLIGPPGTGKTSFYNSCITALSDERRVKDPFTVRSGGDCVTVR
ncbi:Glycoside hydrolase 2 (Mannanase, beta-galactosidase), partial [Bonamia ostreae]